MKTKTIIGLMLIIVISFFIYQYIDNKKEMERIVYLEKVKKAELIKEREIAEEKSNWEYAKEINTIDSYQQYLNTHRNGLHTNAAHSSINKLKEEALQQKLYKLRVDLVNNLSKKAGDLIIRKAYDNGSNKTTIVNDWRYDKSQGAEKGIFTVSANLTWNGDWVASNYYKASGIISFYEDGSNVKWTPSYINATLANYLDNMSSAILGTVILVGTVEALNE